MNKSLLNLFGLLLFTLLISGCKKDESKTASCPYIEEAPPRFMFATDSVKTDSTITITIFYNNQKHCQLYDSFSSSTVDSTTTIALQTKIDTCNCQDQFDGQYQYFHYQAPHTPGHSIIKIHVINSLFYGDTIVVY